MGIKVLKAPFASTAIEEASDRVKWGPFRVVPSEVFKTGSFGELIPNRAEESITKAFD
jgi:hypothetical protein